MPYSVGILYFDLFIFFLFYNLFYLKSIFDMAFLFKNLEKIFFIYDQKPQFIKVKAQFININ